MMVTETVVWMEVSPEEARRGAARTGLSLEDSQVKGLGGREVHTGHRTRVAREEGGVKRRGSSVEEGEADAAETARAMWREMFPEFSHMAVTGAPSMSCLVQRWVRKPDC